MSQLQNIAKPHLLPLIDDNWSSLSAWSQRIIAAWATMFSMVFEFADINTQAATFEQREKLRLTATPPEGWTVWIAPFKGVKWGGAVNHFGWSVPTDVSILPTAPDTQSTAFVLGRTFFITLSFAVPGDTVDAGIFAERAGLKTIWPIAEDTVVRPNNILDDVTADIISSALQPLPRHMVRRAWEH